MFTVYCRKKIEKFWAVFRPQSWGGLIHGSENLQSTVAPAVSPVSCIDNCVSVVSTCLWNQPLWRSYRTDAEKGGKRWADTMCQSLITVWAKVFILSWANSILHCFSARPSKLSRSSLTISYVLHSTAALETVCWQRVIHATEWGINLYAGLEFWTFFQRCAGDGVLTACHSCDRVGDRLICGSRILDIFSVSKSGGWLICGSPYMWEYTVLSKVRGKAGQYLIEHKGWSWYRSLGSQPMRT